MIGGLMPGLSAPVFICVKLCTKREQTPRIVSALKLLITIIRGSVPVFVQSHLCQWNSQFIPVGRSTCKWEPLRQNGTVVSAPSTLCRMLMVSQSVLAVESTSVPCECLDRHLIRGTAWHRGDFPAC